MATFQKINTNLKRKPGAQPGNKNRLGIPHNDEIRKKIGNSLKGRKPWNAGGHISEETKNKISDTLKGRVFSPETRQKLREAAIGRIRAPFSEEWRKKMGDAHRGIKLTPEWRKNISNAQKGEKGNNWQGGKTPINIAIRFSVEYKLWREAVFKRDDYLCQECDSLDRRNIQAHHIKPFSLFPELRLAIDNGITLCIPCHKNTDSYGRKINKIHE